MNKVQEFLAGADLYRIREQNKMAAFMLHQVAEHALNTLLQVTMGLGVNTHNLDKLIRYSSMVSYKLLQLFPRESEKEKHLFKLLQTAYINARYKDDYHIQESELNILSAMVKALKNEVENIFKTKHSTTE